MLQHKFSFQGRAVEECVCTDSAPLGSVECQVKESVGRWSRVWQDSRWLLSRVSRIFLQNGSLSHQCLPCDFE